MADTAIPDEEAEREITALAAARLGRSEDEVRARLKVLHDDRGLDYAYITRNSLLKFSDDQVDAILESEAAQRSRRDYPGRIARELGIPAEEAAARLSELSEKLGMDEATVYQKGYWRMSPKAVRTRVRRREDKNYERIVERAEAAGMTPEDFYRKLRFVKTKYGDATEHFYGLGLSRLTDEELATFISMADRIYLMRKYNSSRAADVFNNKARFLDFFREEAGRGCWTNTEGATPEGLLALTGGGGRVMVKPLASSQGKGIRKLEVTPENVGEVFDELMAGRAVIVEPFIAQHPDLATIGGGCVNTVRVATILEDGVCNVLYAALRVGSGDTVDNHHSGGIAYCVDLETGKVCSSGMALDGTATDVDVATGKPILGFQVPLWDEVLDLVKRSAFKTPDVRFVGWDVAVTPDGPVLIEGNADSQFNLIEYTAPGARTGHRAQFARYLDEV